jgi:hypothetical protein
MTFPTLVYKTPGNHRFRNGKTYRYISVANEDELNRAIADGWVKSKEDAIYGVKVEVKEEPISDAPPTREEMETKAKQLGLKFDGRTSDRKLMTIITEALEKGDGLD